MKIISIIMGSDSDLPVMSPAAQICEDMGVPYEITIVSAHRTPDRMYSYAKAARERGVGVIIAGAGGAAHLPGMVAAMTNIPVIGVPVKTSTLSGVDSLYSIAQMPGGVPVATVAINGGLNAGLLACEILGVFEEDLYQKLEAYKQNLRQTVEEKAAKLKNSGYLQYTP